MTLTLFWKIKNITGLQTISDEIEINLEIYLKLFILLYADDTALLAETAILPIFKTSYIAFSALSARCFFVKLKFPVLVKIISR
jgi:hypothetical protein